MTTPKDSAPCVVVQHPDGRFLSRGTGQNRTWVTGLIEADAFRSEGKAKIAYNHATAPSRQINTINASRRQKGLVTGSILEVPPFFTRPAVLTLSE